jgi:hypothetical protein
MMGDHLDMIPSLVALWQLDATVVVLNALDAFCVATRLVNSQA